MVSSVVYLTSSIGHLYDVIYQNNASSLHDFNPRFSSGFHSLIARDSRNDSFSQLSDLLNSVEFLLLVKPEDIDEILIKNGGKSKISGKWL